MAATKPEGIEAIRARWADLGPWSIGADRWIVDETGANVALADYASPETYETRCREAIAAAPADVEALFKALEIERATSAFWRARSQYLLDSDAHALAKSSGAPASHVEIMRRAVVRAHEREVAAGKRCADLGINPWDEADAEDRRSDEGEGGDE